VWDHVLTVVGRYISLPSEYHLTDRLFYHLLHVAATTNAASFPKKKKKKGIMQKVTGWGTLVELPDILMVY
jgi:hypothetical protein